MNWINNGKYIEGTFIADKFQYKNKIASFDLDGTLIKVKSGNKFPTDFMDWIFFNDTVINKLIELYKNDFCIIIISNQAGIAKGKQDETSWKKKLDMICSKINIPIKIFASRDNDVFRKPYCTLWNVIINDINNVDKNSFYCGDACGRINDHSDTDYKFALNCNIKFLTPEQLFNNKINSDHNLTYNIDFKDIKKINSQYPSINFIKKDLIIMVGYPGSGKSTFVNDILVPKGYFRINMDTLKTKAKCIKECTKQLMLGNSVVIDNTNSNKETRKIYIDIAIKQKYNIRCIQITSDLAISYHSSHYRCYKSHGNIKSIPMVVYHKFKKSFEEPNLNENFKEIIKVPFIPPKDDDFYLYFY